MTRLGSKRPETSQKVPVTVAVPSIAEACAACSAAPIESYSLMYVIGDIHLGLP